MLHPVLSFLLLTSFCLLPSACTSGPAPSTPLADGLTPFLTASQSPSQTPDIQVVAETPLPTPTPFTYTVQRGDTISSIALEQNVSIDDLLAANPDISPNAMPVGQVINIPSNPENPSGEPTPTPAAFTIQQIECYPTADQGMWCFVLARNESPDFMENISAQLTLVDANNVTLASQTALLPLNILPPNTSLPLTVFFPPPLGIPPDAKPQVQVLTAIRLLPNDARYLPATINNTLVQVNADGRSAHVNGQVRLPDGSKAASQVWVTGTAYDEARRVVGVRRWEANADLTSGGNLPFAFMVFSLGGRIERVEFAVEARP
ncbi:MAG TPA: LysM peptidoglycan-binding domain-containing protein [Anaerolineales bacterium]|nr:LysM peptidoglycan-binding domain-containing protein [Anaerolineales bacterium]